MKTVPLLGVRNAMRIIILVLRELDMQKILLQLVLERTVELVIPLI